MSLNTKWKSFKGWCGPKIRLFWSKLEVLPEYVVYFWDHVRYRDEAVRLYVQYDRISKAMNGGSKKSRGSWWIPIKLASKVWGYPPAHHWDDGRMSGDALLWSAYLNGGTGPMSTKVVDTKKPINLDRLNKSFEQVNKNIPASTQYVVKVDEDLKDLMKNHKPLLPREGAEIVWSPKSRRLSHEERTAVQVAKILGLPIPKKLADEVNKSGRGPTKAIFTIKGTKVTLKKPPRGF